ncbi:serine/threonine-protein kinase [Streptomyces sp. NPDC093225]|uniref:serine/threonine-protein kinase n=1 Tax=Streptomyces sp. NPDC093225 TaxID=3366034 RepID=UPI0037FF2099
MPSTQQSGAQPVHSPLSADDPREIGGYRLHARIGAGGMGLVYLAHTPGGRPIALKVVREDFAADPGFRRRFAQEVASARRIHGLFTAQVVDAGVDAPLPWLATAYVPGPSLQQLVERYGPLPARSVLLLVAGIAEALQAVHGAGVVHRDLKPANVLVAEDGPRVIDFGIARAADDTGLTGTGLRIGTAAYMAPEQALGRAVTPATDVFALGALAAYVAGGGLPFGAGPESAALYRVVHEPADLSRVPAELHGLLVRCLAKDPGLRPTPAELIAAVRAHPAVGPSAEFGDGWLPGAVGREVTRRAAAPAAAGSVPSGPGAHGSAPSGSGFPAPGFDAPGFDGAGLPAPTLLDAEFGAAFPHAQPTQAVPAARAVPDAVHGAVAGAAGAAGPGAPGGRDRGGRPGAAGRRSPRGVRRGRTARTARVVGVLVALGAVAGAVYWFDVPGGDDGGPGVTYAAGYADVELTAPDDGYEFDLDTGKVVPADTAEWYLARVEDGFVVPEDADAFVASGYALGPADCESGLDAEPVASLPYDQLADERPFCVRGADGRLVVARLVEADPGGRVTVALSQYRRNG